MTLDILKSINWVDILVVFLFIRIVYISTQTGFIVEFLKLLGILVSVFISFHYYVALVGSVVQKTPVAQALLYTLSFVALWLVTSLICFLVRNGLFMLFTVQAQSLVDRWGAALISVARFSLVASALLFFLVLSGHGYLKNSTASSLSGRYLLKVAPEAYSMTHQKVVVKFFPDEKYNSAVQAAIMGTR